MRLLTPQTPWRTACSLFAALLAGCAHIQSTTTPVLASRYYGTWMIVGFQHRNTWDRNWWELSATNVASRQQLAPPGHGDYEVCARFPVAAVLAPNQFEATDGTISTLHLAEGHLLVVVNDKGVSVYDRVDASAVCNKSDGPHARAGLPAIRAPVIASRFHGVWVNVLAHQSSWWEIGAKGVTLYGYNAQNACSSLHIAALGPDQVGVEFGSSHASSLHLTEDNLLLGLTEDGSGLALYRRTDGTAICRNPDDGTYAKNAPHVALH